MISVVMATYNGSKYIEKQLNSLLTQTRQIDEVIICDDISSDNTPELIREFIEKNNLTKTWKFSINKKNLGYRRNFSQALRQTHGDYIFFADQDDEWERNKIDEMVSLMEKKRQIKALNCAVTLIDAESKLLPLEKKKKSYNAGFIYVKKPLAELTRFEANFIMRNNISPGCTLAITKELKTLFIENYQAEMPHDWYLNLLAALKQGCYFFNKPLTRYRVHENNTLGVATDTRWQKIIARFDLNKNISEQSDNLEALKNLTISLNMSEKPEVRHLKAYYKARLRYYKEPTLQNLWSLKHYPEYRQDSRLKGRLWDCLILLKLDRMFTKMASKS